MFLNINEGICYFYFYDFKMELTISVWAIHQCVHIYDQCASMNKFCFIHNPQRCLPV